MTWNYFFKNEIVVMVIKTMIVKIIKWYYKKIIIYKIFYKSFMSWNYFQTNELNFKINSKIFFIEDFFFEIF